MWGFRWYGGGKVGVAGHSRGGVVGAVSPYVRKVRTASGTTAVQMVAKEQGAADRRAPGAGRGGPGPRPAPGRAQGLRHQHPRHHRGRARGHQLPPRAVARRAVLAHQQARPGRVARGEARKGGFRTGGRPRRWAANGPGSMGRRGFSQYGPLRTQRVRLCGCGHPQVVPLPARGRSKAREGNEVVIGE